MPAGRAPATTDERRLITSAFLGLSVAHLLGVASILGQALLPVFIQDLGGDALDVGLLMAAATVSGVFMRPTIGRLMDRRGRRLVFGLCGTINALGALGYLAISGVGPLFYAVRLVHGIGIGGLFAAFFTSASDIIPRSRRAEGLAIFGISGMAAGALGPFLGELALHRSGFDVYFWLLFALGAASLALTMIVVDPVRFPPTARSMDGRRSFRKTLSEPGVRRLLPVTITFGVAIGSLNIFLAPYVQVHDLPAISFCFVPYSITSIVLRLLFARLPDRIGPGRVVAPALTVLALGTFALVLDPTPRGLILAGILAGTGHGFAFPVLGALILARSDPAHRGSVLSVFTSCIDIGYLTSGPGLGLLAQSLGYDAAFTAAGICALTGMAYFVVSERVLARTTVGAPQTSA